VNGTIFLGESAPMDLRDALRTIGRVRRVDHRRPS
jgi:hypothetical protein